MRTGRNCDVTRNVCKLGCPKSSLFHHWLSTLGPGGLEAHHTAGQNAQAQRLADRLVAVGRQDYRDRSFGLNHDPFYQRFCLNGMDRDPLRR